MATWLAERRLAQNGARLAELRHELAQIDEQFSVVSSEADDQAKEVLKQVFDMTRAAKSGFLELLITELLRKGMQPEHISPDRLASE